MPSSLDLDPRVDPLLGQTLGGKYTLDRLIGRGGMGHVYSAQVQDATDPEARDVVVKVIAPPLAQQPQAMARFEREAKRLDGLRHSNIVEMYDYGREGGRAYIVMEWVEGELLNEYLARKGALSLADFVPIAAQILKGVGHAHSRDLMIRDIKPANVMLCERKGRANFVKIIDFGLAKMLEGDEDITKQHFIGTSGYLSPEQIKGLDIDLRVDVYALGVLFYQMLSGRMPFEAENDTTLLYKHVHEFPTPLSEVLPDSSGADAEVPEELVHLIHDCLEKDPDDRPRDANEIVEKLIDCVPMSMFKLPPVSASVTEHSAVSALSTSVLTVPTGETANYLRSTELAAAGPQTGSGPIVLPSPTGEHGPTAAAPATGERALAASAILAEPTPTQGGSKLGLVVVGIGVFALLGIGAVVLLGGKDDPQADSNSAAAAVGKLGELEAGLAEVEALVGKGEFDSAETKLATIRGQVGDDPTLSGQVERLDHQIEVARLLDTAKQLDDKGMTEAAIAAYQAVIAVDSSNAEARTRIAELGAGDNGTLAISSDPVADLSIDGSPAGNTPYDKPLSVGDHTLEVSAAGYEVWTKKIEIKTGDNPAIDIKLKPVSGQAGKKPAGTKIKPTVTDQPDPVPEAPPPTPTPTKPEKDNPFLPTKKKNENGPFLPTEK